MRTLWGWLLFAWRFEVDLYKSLFRWSPVGRTCPRAPPACSYVGAISVLLWAFVDRVGRRAGRAPRDPARGRRCDSPPTSSGIWGLMWMLGFTASHYVYPHLVGASGLRLRSGHHVAVDVPWDAVAGASTRERSVDGKKSLIQQDDVLSCPMGGRTNVEVRLARPLEVVVRGETVEVTEVRFFADEPRAGVAADQPRGQWAKWRVPVRYMRDAGRLAAAMTSSSRTEPPGWTTARTPASSSTSQAVGEREEGVGGGDRPRGPLPGPRDGEPRRVDAVDLAHADADRGAVRGEQDRVGLHRTAGPPGEREVGEDLVGDAAVAGRERPGGRVVARGVDAVALCSSTPPLIGAHARRGRRAPAARHAAAGCSSCAAAPRRRRRRSPARRSTSVKTSATCSAIATDDRRGWPR